MSVYKELEGHAENGSLSKDYLGTFYVKALKMKICAVSCGS